MPSRPWFRRQASATTSRRRGLRRGVLKMRHHMLRESAQAIKDFLLRHGLERIEQEVDTIDADRLPTFACTQHAVRIADRDSLGHAGLIAGTGDFAA